jgi:predicted enzyme related to lactoylglutathione lyase
MIGSADAGTPVRLVAIAFHAAAPAELAGFWSHALGWRIGESGAGAVELMPTDATTFRLRLGFGAVEKVAQNRVHFDLTTRSLHDQKNTVTELLAMGANHTDVGQGPTDAQIVLADPEGNEFCVIEPDNRFLSGCPRLGAVNCDGTRALGYFYSSALGWPLVWDQDEETAIQELDGTGPKITWSGPPLMPKPEKERLHFHLAPASGATGTEALDHLLALGATRPSTGPGCTSAILLNDVDGNDFCLVDPERAADGTA